MINLNTIYVNGKFMKRGFFSMSYNDLFSDLFSRELEREPVMRMEFSASATPLIHVKVANVKQIPTKPAGIAYYEKLCREQGLLGIARNPWVPSNLFPERKKH